MPSAITRDFHDIIRQSDKSTVRSDIDVAIMRQVARNVAMHPDFGVDARVPLGRWIKRFASHLRLTLSAPEKQALARISDKHSDAQLTVVESRHLAKIVSRLGDGDASVVEGGADILSANLRTLARELGMAEIDFSIVHLLLRCVRLRALDHLADVLVDEFKGPAKALALMLGGDAAEMQLRMVPNSWLVRSGFLVREEGDDCMLGVGGHFSIPDRIARSLNRPYESEVELFEALAGPRLAGSLGLDDFVWLKPVDHLVRLLRGALEGHSSGINILLYGPPGTGKTGLCAAVGEALGVRVHAVGEASENGEELKRQERLAELRLSQTILSKGTASLILFDEMEDLLTGPLAEKGSKIFLNRLLESNPVPVLWCSNSVGGFDPAMLRRMTLAIRVDGPGAAARVGVWRRLAGREGLVDIPDEEIETLARASEAPPGLVATALRSAVLSGGGLSDVVSTLDALSPLVTGTGRPLSQVMTAAAVGFSPELLNADTDLSALADRLSSLRGVPVQFLLHGPPGTGKSVYVRHLAERMNLPVHVKRTSDLISKYVGESERNIAEAFARAAADGAMLVIDEVDSLLYDRKTARHSWEISQINELLACMDNHPAPVAATTNMIDRLDPACLRRFAFKVRLDCLDASRAALAFKRFFGIDAPAGLAQLHGLTPGDFEAVRRRAAILGQLNDVPALLACLESELRAKPGVGVRMGFV